MCRKRWIRVGPGGAMWLRMDAAVDGYGRCGYGGRDVAGRDVARRDVAREEWGKRRLFVVPLDRVSRRRMCEAWRHPDASVGLGMKGREGVERWGRWLKKGGQGVCVGNGAMRYRVLMEEAIISPTTAALWL